MPSPTSATLTGPTSGQCAVASTNFTVTLDNPADPGGVVVTISSTVGGDTFASSPFTIAAGTSSHTFTFTPSSGGNRNISITTSPALTIGGSPITYMAQAPTVTLNGPASSLCSVTSVNFTVTLSQPACVGGVAVTVSSSVAGDTITPSSFTIAAGATSGTFTVTATSCGSRNISITTNPPAVGTFGNPKVYTANCACPDDAGSVNQSQAWTQTGFTCPSSFAIGFSLTPTTTAAIDLYCTTGTISLSIHE